MKELIGTNTRDIARELARRYSTMTHEELDLLESILVPIKYAKGELILKEGEICRQLLYIDCANSISSMVKRLRSISHRNIQS